MTGTPPVEKPAMVFAVIPTYHPSPELRDRVLALLSQVAGIVLVDDGTASTSTLGMDDKNIHIIELAENSGIAHALNVGISAAKAAGATHLLTLDQDSWVPDGYVKEALEALQVALAAGQNPAGAVPESAGGHAVLREPDGQPFDPIQAGQILRTEVFDRLGPFAEELFIDAVDSEYGLRVRASGCSYVIVPNSDIGHELGTLVPLRVFGRHLVVRGRPRHVLYHAPFRTYYIVRNSLLIRARYGKAFRAWFRKRDRKLSSMLVGGILGAPDRRAQLLALRQGFVDGRGGVTGRISPALNARLADASRRAR
ncbi:glycosyltransferase [Microbacterium sp. 22242]|uniref:glycosyltransferase n=1 Tax=Microbacterium sp. 22242 TaxID=3453896 RepID=UPI003F832A16